MKRITLFTIFLLAISFGLLKAQTNQGKMLIGVASTINIAGASSDLFSLGYTSIKQKSDADGFEESDPDKTTSINLSPKVGYFVVDNLALGLDINIASSTEKEKYGDDIDKYTQTLLSIGPFVRYYIPTSNVLPFFEISGSFGSITNKSDYSDNSYWDDDESKFSVMSIAGGIGLAAPLGEKVTFDVLAGYSSLTVKDKEDNEDNDRTVIGTIGLKLGFTILIGSN